MEYVEMLRARRVLTWYGAILFACVALGLALAFKDGSPRIQLSHDQNPMIPFRYLLAGAAIGPLILAAFLGLGLDAEYKTIAITWTRPISRLSIALRFLAVDGGALVIAWVLSLAAVLIPIFAVGIAQYITFGGPIAISAVLVFGAAVMWYGLVVLVTTLLPGRGAAVAGGSWGYALFVPTLAALPFPPLLHQVVLGLNYVNPMAYVGGKGDGHQLIAGTDMQHAVAAWLIGLVALAIATQVWTKREVPA